MSENSFFILQDNECYFFSYANLNIDLLSIILNRERDSILYQNCILRNFVRIFCVNKDNNSIASIHYDPDSSVYGIVVKITYDELDLLKSYHKNYSLKNIRIEYTSSHVKSTMIVKEDSKILLKYIDSDLLLPYVFICDDYINNDRILPSEIYISEIRKMLNDRKKIENTSFKKIMILCVTNIFTNTDKYYHYYYYDVKTESFKNIEYDESNEKIVILGYENI